MSLIVPAEQILAAIGDTEPTDPPRRWTVGDVWALDAPVFRGQARPAVVGPAARVAGPGVGPATPPEVPAVDGVTKEIQVASTDETGAFPVAADETPAPAETPAEKDDSTDSDAAETADDAE